MELPMKRYAALLLLLVACSKDSSGPAGIDPTVLITNQLAVDTVFFTWRDGQGVVGADTILPGTTSCTRFLARADSAYFQATASFQGAATLYTQPWFDPGSRSAWTMMVVHTNGSPDINVTDVSPRQPC